MAQSKWKRVLVTLPSGEKAYRYTDGNSYRILPPAKDATKDRNERRGLSGGSSGPSLSEQARQLAGPAGGETRTARAQGRDTKQNKPAAKPTNTGPKPGNYKSSFAGARDKAHAEAKKITGQTPAKPSQTTPSKQTRTGSSNNTVSRAVTGKPAPTPAGKVPSSNETYRDGGKGLYQGSKEYRDKVGGSGNPLLNRFRKDMGRDTDTGAKTDGVGPVSSGSNYAKSKDVSQAQSDANKARVKQGPPAPKKESLKERMERMKKRRQGTAWGGVD
jgi:hypothetical protein